MTRDKKSVPKTYVEKISLNPQGHPLSDDLAGKAVRLEYSSGHILEQHWQTSNKVLWRGVSGPWLTDVILDFNKMQATASWIGPTDEGGAEYVLDQATMIYVECDMCIE